MDLTIWSNTSMSYVDELLLVEGVEGRMMFVSFMLYILAPALSPGRKRKSR